jgi:hypothetical protein
MQYPPRLKQLEKPVPHLMVIVTPQNLSPPYTGQLLVRGP